MTVCTTCTIARETTGDRIPKGWKRHRGAVYCGDCWRKSHTLRAAIVPVAQPLSGTWDEFRDALAEMWIETTRASNWIMTELYKRDVRRNGEPKMPPMPKAYLYPELRQLFPALTPQSVTSLEQAVTAKYRAKRYEIVWTNACALPTFRYPTPFPVHNQSWYVEFDAGKPIVSARIGDKRWQFRLKAGHQFRRQMADLHAIVNGNGLPGELALYKHHDGQILCKIVAWVPRLGASEYQGIMFVHTGIEHFITAQFSQDAADEAWYLNADHIRRWVREYERHLQRLREDRKAEQRPVSSFANHQQIVVAKQRRRMDSAVKEIAAQIANYARRRHAAQLEYKDAVRHEETFPWFLLKERLKTKCNEYGMEFVYAGANVVDDASQALAAGESQ